MQARLGVGELRCPGPGGAGRALVVVGLVHPSFGLVHRALELLGELVAHAPAPAARVRRAGLDLTEIWAARAASPGQRLGGAGLGDEAPDVVEAVAVDLAGHRSGEHLAILRKAKHKLRCGG